MNSRTQTIEEDNVKLKSPHSFDHVAPETPNEIKV